MHFILKKQLHWWHFLFMVKLEFVLFFFSSTIEAWRASLPDLANGKTYAIREDCNARDDAKPEKKLLQATDGELETLFLASNYVGHLRKHAIYGVKTEITQPRDIFIFTSPPLSGYDAFRRRCCAHTRECQPIYVNPAHAENSNRQISDDQFAHKALAPEEFLPFLRDKN